MWNHHNHHHRHHHHHHEQYYYLIYNNSNCNHYHYYHFSFVYDILFLFRFTEYLPTFVSVPNLLPFCLAFFLSSLREYSDLCIVMASCGFNLYNKLKTCFGDCVYHLRLLAWLGYKSFQPVLPPYSVQPNFASIFHRPYFDCPQSCQLQKPDHRT